MPIEKREWRLLDEQKPVIGARVYLAPMSEAAAKNPATRYVNADYTEALEQERDELRARVEELEATVLRVRAALSGGTE